MFVVHWDAWYLRQYEFLGFADYSWTFLDAASHYATRKDAETARDEVVRLGGHRGEIIEL